MLDLSPAAERMRKLVGAVRDEHLDAPTPCEGTTVGDLLDHVMGLSLAFRRAAQKQNSAADGGPPEPSAANLPPDWRAQTERRLDDLAAAWRDPAAWDGVTAAGGLDLPAHEAGIVALDELVLHGWDLARALNLPYECDQADAEACFAFTSQVPEAPEAREGLFGPVVPVPEDAPLFERALGLSGRDPHWKP